MSWKDSISPIETPDTAEQEPGLGEAALEKVGALGAGLAKGASLGFADELGGAAAAAYHKLAQDEGDASLSELYNKYKQLTKQKLDEAQEKSLLGKVGEIGGNIATGALLLPTGVGLAGTALAGAGAGALQSAGESEGQDLSEIGKDVAKGAVSGAAFGALGHGIAKGAGALAKKAMDSPMSAQLAATFKNAEQGGSIFGKEAGDVLQAQGEKLSKNVGEELLQPIAVKSQRMSQAFKAAEEAGKKLQPSEEAEQVIKGAAKKLRIGNIVDDIESKINPEIETFARPSALTELSDTTTDFGSELKKLLSGKMSPEEANSFRTRFKDYVYNLGRKGKEEALPSLVKKAESLNESGLVDTIEDLSKNAGVDISKMNADIHESRNAIEKILGLQNTSSKDPQVVAEEAASAIQRILGQEGQTTLQGDKGRQALKTLYQNVKDYAKDSDLNIDPNKMLEDISNLALKKAARRNVTGVTEASTETTKGLINSIGNKILASPYAMTEAVAKRKIPSILGGEKLAKSLSGVSDKILSADNEQLKLIASEFGKNPQFEHLAKELAQAIETGSKQKLNSALFVISQTPAARELANKIIPGTE